jgi:hypothetical protein
LTTAAPILEAALPAEGISGSTTSNPSLTRLFNELYSGLIDTAREVWCHGQPGAQASALQPPIPRRRAGPLPGF